MPKLNTIFVIIRWPLAVLCIHMLLTYTGGYYWWAHIDKAMHLLGGMSIAAGTIPALNYFKSQSWIGFINPLLFMVFIIAIVALTAVGWEFFEFILDHTLRTNMQPSVADTMGDLLCGLIGGTLIALAIIKSNKDTV